MASPFPAGFRSAGPFEQYWSKVAWRLKVCRDDGIGTINGAFFNVDRQLDIVYIGIIILIYFISMTWYEVYLYWLFFLKMIEMYLWVKSYVWPDETTVHYLRVADRVFAVFLAGLMIYLFNPFTKKTVYIDHETKGYLFTFACLTLFYLIPPPSFSVPSLRG